MLPQDRTFGFRRDPRHHGPDYLASRIDLRMCKGTEVGIGVGSRWGGSRRPGSDELRDGSEQRDDHGEYDPPTLVDPLLLVLGASPGCTAPAPRLVIRWQCVWNHTERPYERPGRSRERAVAQRIGRWSRRVRWAADQADFEPGPSGCLLTVATSVASSFALLIASAI
jgi:hypothetical protein